ncbi:permease [Bifidobacterium goeldii]|uniref:Permease n=1 Tax=Bifidobacterium goeldii TaxID=2306975 RepID=A0A430FNG1_9BIFI|nr:AEC family transporter [Bifidobacterium goeldii]RSX54368.1 permease [Bifidobacterium goeldii]
MAQFDIVLGQLVGFFIMLLVGYVCVRLKFYGTTALNGMCSLLLNVLIPVLVFANAVDGTTRSELAANWGVMLLTALMYTLLIVLFALVAWVLRLRGSRGHIFQASMIFGNAGFIGIPLIMALFPRHGAIFVALMSIVDQALLWTYGVWLCEPVRGNAHTSAERNAESAATLTAPVRSTIAAGLMNLLRRFMNPAFIGVMIALAFILAGVRVPKMILTPLHTIGAMATPMSLIYLGGLFALTKWWNVLRRYELYVGMTLKMIAFPLVFHAGLTALAAAVPVLPITGEMIETITLISGLPTMTTIAMFAGRKDNMPDYAVGMVLVTTLFSLLSLTIVSAVVF